MVPSQCAPPSQVMRTESPVEVPVFIPGYEGQQKVSQAPSSSESQRRYAERVSETGKCLSRALYDIETAQPSQYLTLLSTILTIPLADLQNGCLTLTLPDRNRRAAGIIQILLDRVDPQTLDATHEAFRSFWQESSAVAADVSSQCKSRKPTKRPRREAGHSSTRGRMKRHAAGASPSLNPPPNFCVDGNAYAASDVPMSTTRSTISQDQTTITPSGGDFAFHFPPDDHERLNAGTMKAIDFNLQGEAFTHSVPLYDPFPMSTLGQTRSWGDMAYPGSAHCMNEMIPRPSQAGPSTTWALPYPHQPFNSKEVPQAGTSHLIPYHFLPSTAQATSTHLMHPQPRHRPSGWQTAAGPSRSRNYPSHEQIDLASAKQDPTRLPYFLRS